MTDYRFPSPGVDNRFPGGGVDNYFDNGGRFVGGVDLRFTAPGIGIPPGPTLSSAAVNGTSLALTFSEAMKTTNLPPGSAFVVLCNGIARTVSSLSASGSVVTLVLAIGAAFGETVTVAYTDPTGGDDTNALQSVDGRDVASFGPSAVTNNTPSFVYTAATGGTVTTVGDYKVHTFLANGTFTVTQAGTDPLEVLLVGGGASGSRGYPVSGKGGGGGDVRPLSLALAVGNHAVTIGQGGAISTGGQSSDGGYTFLGSNNAPGGYGTGANAYDPGGRSGNNNTGGPYTGNSGGGGGGAGAASTNETGGAGKVTAFGTFGGGGGGGANPGTSTPRGLGGTGGGGDGGNGFSPGASAPANTGGGGGGGGGQYDSSPGNNGGAGGSGIVIIRYKFQN